MFCSNLTQQNHARLVKLVGEKCTVKCRLNGKETEALWDTGAHVSIIPQWYLSEHLPGLHLRDISELLDVQLNLTTANGTVLSYSGWVEVSFRLKSSRDELMVPFLVSNESGSTPVIGYNVIKQVFQDSGIAQNIADAQMSFPNLREAETHELCSK